VAVAVELVITLPHKMAAQEVAELLLAEDQHLKVLEPQVKAITEEMVLQTLVETRLAEQAEVPVVLVKLDLLTEA
jgi:hypothetical protein